MEQVDCCPKCGSWNIVYTETFFRFRIKCKDCGFQSPPRLLMEDAVRLWNYRENNNDRDNQKRN